MSSYTAVLFPNPDGSYGVRVPALPSCRAEGVTRGQALDNARAAIIEALADIAKSGQRPPREERSPVRTVWVQNPRRGDTVPYVVVLEDAPEGGVSATPVLFPDLHVVAPTADEALSQVGPSLFEHLVDLVANKRLFPIQDDAQAYVVRVPTP